MILAALECNSDWDYCVIFTACSHYFRMTSSLWKSGGEEHASQGTEISDLKPWALMRHKTSETAFKTEAANFNLQSSSLWFFLCFTRLFIRNRLCILLAWSVVHIVDGHIFVPYKVLSLSFSIAKNQNSFSFSVFTKNSRQDLSLF